MNNSNPILTIETSDTLCNVGIYFSEDKYFESILNERHSHSERLVSSVDYILKISDTELKKIDSIVVSSGPGSFTGLRIGLTAAKGLAYGANLPIILVPTFEALALQISAYLKDGAEFIIANKVNSDEIYYAKFQVKENKFIFVEELQIVKKSDFLNVDGLQVFGNAFKNSKNNLFRNLSSPSSVYLAKWSKLFGEKLKTYDFDYLEPNYLKDFIIKVNK
ncbi:MAG TPA: tRNA (adenosine(37)-N6)-threonylcarbamoyltransferase complex dimerization subunit type 1 TsaB [Ignavibacteriaceae bacterium]|nr:tRNA (adenosine(37)-N6)-threonylcarbamoyltransferase complex dimerization subunit type 1 TsaB [Ignavibacteriaceae bacterium]